ncbi:transposase [Mycobacterium shigaense]|uniref:Transposase n=1 Tax=Mycobacterium shigaense TaxID=722731 RepID=A0A1Z4EEJ1_9MYCO|nr:transposase [Mycobacterium shigaense]
MAVGCFRVVQPRGPRRRWWVARLKAAHNAGRLPAELAKLRRIGLLVVDEVGYIPFEQDAANLFFQRHNNHDHVAYFSPSLLAYFSTVVNNRYVSTLTGAAAH